MFYVGNYPVFIFNIVCRVDCIRKVFCKIIYYRIKHLKYLFNQICKCKIIYFWVLIFKTIILK